jgi:hypothetical protein
MAEQVQQAAITGMGTTKAAGAGPLVGTTNILTLLGVTALPAYCKGADFQVIAGPLYIENDGTTADANCIMVDVGQIYPVRNGGAYLSQLRFYCAGAYDVRIALNG